MDAPITTPTNSQALKNRILQQYFNCQDCAVSLRQWMLRPAGHRTGTFFGHFAPFYTAFLTLYSYTSVLPQMQREAELSKKIEAWNAAVEGIVRMPYQRQDKRARAGLKLYDDWIVSLHNQLIIEFS